jgi:hypothetical protein
MILHDVLLKFVLMVLILTTILLSNCATQRYEYGSDVITEYDLSEEEVMQLQFYLTDPIYLYKLGAVEFRNTIEFHVLKQERTSEITELVLKKGTPGVPVEQGSDWIDIDFGNDLVMRFKNFLGGNKIQRINGFNVFESPKIEYRGEPYYVQFEEHESHQEKGEFRRIPEVELIVAKEKKAFFQSNRQVLKGKKIP